MTQLLLLSSGDGIDTAARILTAFPRLLLLLSAGDRSDSVAALL